MAKKVELKERGTNETIYPVTQTGCVVDSNGKDLEERLKSNEIVLLNTVDYAPDAQLDPTLITPEQGKAIALKYKELLQTYRSEQILLNVSGIEGVYLLMQPYLLDDSNGIYIYNSSIPFESDTDKGTINYMASIQLGDSEDECYFGVSGQKGASGDILDKHINNETSVKHIPSGGAAGQILEWKSSGEAQWVGAVSLFPGFENVLAYGVEWKQNVKDPHLTRIGNPTLHKTLPIQSQLKGCIAQGNKIMYWLHPDDWKMKSTAKQLTGETLNDSKGLVSCEDVEGKPYSSLYTYELGTDMTALDFKVGDHVLIKGFSGISAVGEVLSIENGANSEISKVIKIRFDFDTLYEKEKMTGDAGGQGTKLTLKGEPSRLDGYDGTVRVYCPQFYIKSETVNDTSRVWISTVKIDDDWTQQPEILIDAYRSTVLNTVPENMGYLSTLPVDSAVSIVNTATYCRGGNNRPTYDKYLEGVEASEGVEAVTKDIFRTDLGKARTNKNIESSRYYARKASSELLSYDSYKNIFYWLYVIEYANFNCQETYNSTLTEEGYHQGGMGDGITTMSRLGEYNEANPLTPCGYGNSIGNGTGLVPINIPEFTYGSDNETVATQTLQMPRWRGFDNPFGDIWTALEGIFIEVFKDYLVYDVYTCQDPNKYNRYLTESYIKVAEGYRGSGYISHFDLETAAHIIPNTLNQLPVQYKCDYQISDSTIYNDSDTRIFVVGGMASMTNRAGLACISINYGHSSSKPEIGFRTISKEAVLFPNKYQ